MTKYSGLTLDISLIEKDEQEKREEEIKQKIKTINIKNFGELEEIKNEQPSDILILLTDQDYELSQGSQLVSY